MWPLPSRTTPVGKEAFPRDIQGASLVSVQGGGGEKKPCGGPALVRVIEPLESCALKKKKKKGGEKLGPRPVSPPQQNFPV